MTYTGGKPNKKFYNGFTIHIGDKPSHDCPRISLDEGGGIGRQPHHMAKISDGIGSIVRSLFDYMGEYGGHQIRSIIASVSWVLIL